MCKRRFGTSRREEPMLLAPLYQCCAIRLSTVDRLLALYNSPGQLSHKMRHSLKTDILESVLTEAHLAALDRRLAIVLDEIYQCTENFPHRPVIINDGL
jgi:Golgi casein kinase, C-terminal, Fam20